MTIVIAKNKRLSEFEIQAKALALLKDVLGDEYIIRGEYNYRGCRFDLAIFKAATRELICTIEIKKRTNRTGRKLTTIRQIHRYEAATRKPCILLHEGNLDQVVAHLAVNMKRPRPQKL